MTVDEFWEHIDATAETDLYRHGKRLVERLSALPPEEILDFDFWWVQARNEAHTATMTSASYLICGDSLGDDGFLYFTGWLTLRGRATFTRAVADPDSLAEFDFVFDDVTGLSLRATRRPPRGSQSTASPRAAAMTGFGQRPRPGTASTSVSPASTSRSGTTMRSSCDDGYLRSQPGSRTACRPLRSIVTIGRPLPNAGTGGTSHLDTMLPSFLSAVSR